MPGSSSRSVKERQTVLVTGGAGYVGSVLVRRLLSEGYHVVCLDNLRTGGTSLLGVWHHPRFEFCKADITERTAVDPILTKQRYFALVHLAAIVGDPACKLDPELSLQTNWHGSQYLYQAAQDLGVERFIFASTCSNYGKMSDPQSYVDENSPLSPVSLYAELKVKFERIILEETPPKADFCPTSLRFSTVYGLSPRMRFDLTVNEFTKELALGKELVVYGEQFWRPYCHVVDFSRAIIGVLRAAKHQVAYEVFNVGDTAENYTKKRILEELGHHFPDAKIKRVDKQEDPRDYRVNFDKIANQLNFKISRTVRDGIDEVKKSIQWGVIQDPENQVYYNIPHTA
jgi:nucleoside-diphosphate-sugar epimerase